MASKKWGRRCCFPGCFIRDTVRGQLTLFKFPTDKKRCTEWLDACKNAAAQVSSTLPLPGVRPNNSFICELHFEHHMFSNFDKTRLFPHAKPMISTARNAGKAKGLEHIRNDQILSQCTMNPVDRVIITPPKYYFDSATQHLSLVPSQVVISTGRISAKRNLSKSPISLKRQRIQETRESRGQVDLAVSSDSPSIAKRALFPLDLNKKGSCIAVDNSGTDPSEEVTESESGANTTETKHVSKCLVNSRNKKKLKPQKLRREKNTEAKVVTPNLEGTLTSAEEPRDPEITDVSSNSAATVTPEKEDLRQEWLINIKALEQLKLTYRSMDKIYLANPSKNGIQLAAKHKSRLNNSINEAKECKSNNSSLLKVSTKCDKINQCTAEVAVADKAIETSSNSKESNSIPGNVLDFIKCDKKGAASNNICSFEKNVKESELTSKTVDMPKLTEKAMNKALPCAQYNICAGSSDVSSTIVASSHTTKNSTGGILVISNQIQRKPIVKLGNRNPINIKGNKQKTMLKNAPAILKGSRKYLDSQRLKTIGQGEASHSPNRPEEKIVAGVLSVADCNKQISQTSIVSDTPSVELDKPLNIGLVKENDQSDTQILNQKSGNKIPDQENINLCLSKTVENDQHLLKCHVEKPNLKVVLEDGKAIHENVGSSKKVFVKDSSGKISEMAIEDDPPTNNLDRGTEHNYSELRVSKIKAQHMKKAPALLADAKVSQVPANSVKCTSNVGKTKRLDSSLKNKRKSRILKRPAVTTSRADIKKLRQPCRNLKASKRYAVPEIKKDRKLASSLKTVKLKRDTLSKKKCRNSKSDVLSVTSNTNDSTKSTDLIIRKDISNNTQDLEMPFPDASIINLEHSYFKFYDENNPNSKATITKSTRLAFRPGRNPINFKEDTNLKTYVNKNNSRSIVSKVEGENNLPNKTLAKESESLMKESDCSLVVSNPEIVDEPSSNKISQHTVNEPVTACTSAANNIMNPVVEPNECYIMANNSNSQFHKVLLNGEEYYLIIEPSGAQTISGNTIQKQIILNSNVKQNQLNAADDNKNCSLVKIAEENSATTGEYSFNDCSREKPVDVQKKMSNTSNESSKLVRTKNSLENCNNTLTIVEENKGITNNLPVFQENIVTTSSRSGASIQLANSDFNKRKLCLEAVQQSVLPESSTENFHETVVLEEYKNTAVLNSDIGGHIVIQNNISKPANKSDLCQVNVSKSKTSKSCENKMSNSENKSAVINDEGPYIVVPQFAGPRMSWVTVQNPNSVYARVPVSSLQEKPLPLQNHPTIDHLNEKIETVKHQVKMKSKHLNHVKRLNSRLKSQLAKVRAESKEKTMQIKELEKKTKWFDDLTPVAKQIIQIPRGVGKHPCNLPKEVKEFSLGIYSRSPEAYLEVRQAFPVLPHKSTLHRWFRSMVKASCPSSQEQMNYRQGIIEGLQQEDILKDDGTAIQHFFFDDNGDRQKNLREEFEQLCRDVGEDGIESGLDLNCSKNRQVDDADSGSEKSEEEFLCDEAPSIEVILDTPS